MNKLFQAMFVACLYTVGNAILASFDITLDKTNPSPLNNTDFPAAYLYDAAKDSLKKGLSHGGSGIKISAMPYYSRADIGTSLTGQKNTELGDLPGRWNLFAILNTDTPDNYSPSDLLGDAATTSMDSETIFADLVNDLADLSYGGSSNTSVGEPSEFSSMEGLLSLQNSDELVGFLTIPTKYRKYGTKFEVSGSTDNGFGATIQIGVASISQTASFNNAIGFGNVDITSTTAGTTSTTTTSNAAYYIKNNVRTLVNNPFYNDATYGKVTDQQWYAALKCMQRGTTNRLNEIATAIGLNLSDFQKTGLEDLRGELFWRKGLKLNTKDPVVFTPFISVFGTLDLGEICDQSQPLSVPFGNNGHKSFGGNMGFTLDFNDNFEIGAALGIATYTSRTEQNMRMPNHSNQCGIYPFSTAATINPGNTAYTSLLMNSRHFEENLSFFMQYIYVGHSKDKITLVTDNDGFLPQILEGKSIWSNHMANVGLNYEVSPGVTLGCAAQIPLKQRNSYRGSTFALSISASH